MDIRVAAYAVIVEDGRGMLLAHWNEGPYSGWTLPGGGLDPGEDPADAVVREVQEETGYDVRVGPVIGVRSHVIPAGRRLDPAATGPLHALGLVYRAEVTGGRLRDEIGGTTDTAGWFALDEVDALDRVELVDLARGVRGAARSGYPRHPVAGVRRLCHRGSTPRNEREVHTSSWVLSSRSVASAWPRRSTASC